MTNTYLLPGGGYAQESSSAGQYLLPGAGYATGAAGGGGASSAEMVASGGVTFGGGALFEVGRSVVASGGVSLGGDGDPVGTDFVPEIVASGGVAIGGAGAPVGIYINAPTFVGWNSLDKASGIAVSGDELTVTGPAGGFIRSRRSYSSGKWYFEVTVNSGKPSIGIALGSTNVTYALGSDPPPHIVGTSNGTISWPLSDEPPFSPIFVEGSLGVGSTTASAPFDVFVEGAVWGILVDFQSSVITVKWGVDPTKQAVYSFSSGGSYWFGAAAVAQSGVGLSDPEITANFGASAFVYGLPSGASPWGADYAIAASGGLAFSGIAGIVNYVAVIDSFADASPPVLTLTKTHDGQPSANVQFFTLPGDINGRIELYAYYPNGFIPSTLIHHGLYADSEDYGPSFAAFPFSGTAATDIDLQVRHQLTYPAPVDFTAGGASGIYLDIFQLSGPAALVLSARNPASTVNDSTLYASASISGVGRTFVPFSAFLDLGNAAGPAGFFTGIDLVEFRVTGAAPFTVVVTGYGRGRALDVFERGRVIPPVGGPVFGGVDVRFPPVLRYIDDFRVSYTGSVSIPAVVGTNAGVDRLVVTGALPAGVVNPPLNYRAMEVGVDQPGPFYIPGSVWVGDTSPYGAGLVVRTVPDPQTVGVPNPETWTPQVLLTWDYSAHGGIDLTTGGGVSFFIDSSLALSDSPESPSIRVSVDFGFGKINDVELSSVVSGAQTWIVPFSDFYREAAVTVGGDPVPEITAADFQHVQSVAFLRREATGPFNLNYIAVMATAGFLSVIERGRVLALPSGGPAVSGTGDPAGVGVGGEGLVSSGGVVFGGAAEIVREQGWEASGGVVLGGGAVFGLGGGGVRAQAKMRRWRGQSRLGDPRGLVINAPMHRWRARMGGGIVGYVPVRRWKIKARLSGGEGVYAKGQMRHWQGQAHLSNGDGIRAQAKMRRWQGNAGLGMSAPGRVRHWRAEALLAGGEGIRVAARLRHWRSWAVLSGGDGIRAQIQMRRWRAGGGAFLVQIPLRRWRAAVQLDVAATGARKVWAINLQTGETTEFQNWPFLGVGRVGQEWYGLAPDGLYLIGGADDDGEFIDAHFTTHPMDFSNPEDPRVDYGALLKRYHSVVVGTRCSVDVRLEADGASVADNLGVPYVYTQTSRSTMQRRISVGRGILSRFLAVRVDRQSGADDPMNLAGLAVEVMPTNRRSGG